MLLERIPINITAEYRMLKISVNHRIEYKKEGFQKPVFAETRIQIIPRRKVKATRTIRVAARK